MHVANYYLQLNVHISYVTNFENEIFVSTAWRLFDKDMEGLFQHPLLVDMLS